MRGLLRVLRIYLMYAGILLALGALLQFAAFRSPANDAPKRPRITGIDHVRLYVSDMNKSREFYSKLIGVRLRGGGCFGDSTKCLTVGWGRQQTIKLEKAPTINAQDWLAEIAFRTDDIAQMRRYLVAKGVRTSKISRSSYGKYALDAHFEVRDPEGNPLSFVQRFAYPIDDRGPGDPIVQMLHAGFVVKDRDAENKFYLDLLGFKLYWYGGFQDDGVDWYEIQVPDGSDWIEYMLNIPANADHKELGIQNHFSLGVKDIRAAADQLRKNGLTKFDGPEIGRDGKWALDAYDPDGTRVEFMEPTPAGKPCCHPYTAPHPQL